MTMRTRARAVAGCLIVSLSLAGAALASVSDWSIEPTVVPAGARAAVLSAVSCPTRTACTAVGYATSHAGAGVTLAEQRRGSQWSVTRTPALSGARASFLSGVSCAGPRACTAVGFSNDADGTQTPLAERWDGRRWSLQPMTRMPGQLDTQLAGIACAGARSCTAVGFFTNVTGIDVMLAEHWNGTRWAQQTPRYPSGARYVQFSAVSCPSSRSCTAVGLFNDAQGRDAMLAERSNASRWAVERTPTAAGIGSSLGGVSCASAMTCTAVGSSTNRAGATVTLAARSS